jgi:hypothetical protein
VYSPLPPSVFPCGDFCGVTLLQGNFYRKAVNAARNNPYT